MLCESSTYSVQMIDDSGVNILDTPDALMTKVIDINGSKNHKDHNNIMKDTVIDDEPVFVGETKRRSYNRGAFQQMSANKLLADFPP